MVAMEEVMGTLSIRISYEDLKWPWKAERKEPSFPYRLTNSEKFGWDNPHWKSQVHPVPTGDPSAP